MGDIESFTNEAIPGTKTQITVIKGYKESVFIREDGTSEEPGILMLSNETAIKVANFILEG